jgi:hypothetical protein
LVLGQFARVIATLGSFIDIFAVEGDVFELGVYVALRLVVKMW